MSLDSFKDPKVQFNSMLILDRLFRKILVGPSIDQELVQLQDKEAGSREYEQIDIDSFKTRISKKFTHDSREYLHLRMTAILKVWPYIKTLVFSTWSNIRNIVYAIICNWMMPDINLYDKKLIKKFKGDLKKIIMQLLTSKESESRTGGLNILGAVCGMSQNFDLLTEEFWLILDN